MTWALGGNTLGMGDDEGVHHEVLEGRLSGHGVEHKGRLHGGVLLVADHRTGQRVVAEHVGDLPACNV